MMVSPPPEGKFTKMHFVYFSNQFYYDKFYLKRKELKLWFSLTEKICTEFYLFIKKKVRLILKIQNETKTQNDVNWSTSLMELNSELKCLSTLAPATLMNCRGKTTLYRIPPW